MSDFFLDLRCETDRRKSINVAQRALAWTDASRVSAIEGKSLSLVAAAVDGTGNWAPAIVPRSGGRLIVALAGRVALTQAEWNEARNSEGSGGIACRFLAHRFQREGIAGIECQNGNFTIIVIDERSDELHIVTDRSGMVLTFGGPDRQRPTVLGSHPDILATVLGLHADFDLPSLAEFLVSGRISFPSTYYRGISAFPWATTFSFASRNQGWISTGEHRYFEITPDFKDGVSEDTLADDLAAAFRQAIHLRSLPILGKTAVALSGGMDSRAVLSCIQDPGRIEGFVLIDEENPESVTARAIAAARGARFHAIRRSFDHYGNSAEEGARIGGAMGGLASNHFLEVRSWFQENGIHNLLTGCYCDYLFKALALNTREQRWSRRESLTSPQPQFYRPIFAGASRYAEAVGSRLDNWISLNGTPPGSDEAWFQIECRRTFPLAYEGDSAQRVITQRALPWFVPMADSGLLEVYRRIPAKRKLNTRLFRAMMRRLCDPAILEIPNSNTGAHVLAGSLATTYHRYRSALLNRIQRRLSRSLATRGSWPNWEYYLHHSDVVRQQWTRRDSSAMEVLAAITADDILRRPIHDFRGRDVELFQRLWTLKVWLECRVQADRGTGLNSSSRRGS